METGGMSDDRFSDVLPRQPGRPTREEAERKRQVSQRILTELTNARRAAKDGEDFSSSAAIEMLNIADVQHGVTVGWLAQVFRMDPTTVKKKLRDCPPINRRKASYVYDLKVAAQYLVPPVFDVEQYLKTMKPSDLPTHLQEAYWSGMRKRQIWETEAGHLWRTEKVLEVLGEVFQQIKFAIQLWPDEVARASGLSDEQRIMLIGMGDALQKNIHSRLVAMPEKRRTPSTLAETAEIPVEMTDGYSELI